MIDKLRERHGFIGGANQSWPADYSKRQEAARLFITPDLFDLIDVRPITGDEYQTAVARHQNEPQVIEAVGIDETVELLIDIRDAYVRIYFEEWAEARKPYEEFTALLPLIWSRVTEDVRAEWPGREKWFDDVCVPRANVVGEIETRMHHWSTCARDFEEERLSQVPPLATEIPTVVPPAAAGMRLKYPPDFPRQLRALVEDQQDSAEREFDEDRQRTPYYSVREALRRCIMQPFLQFAEIARDEHLWAADEFHDKCMEFLKRASLDIGQKKDQLSKIAFNGEITPEWDRFLKESLQYQTYKDIKRDVIRYVVRYRADIAARERNRLLPTNWRELQEACTATPPVIPEPPKPAEQGSPSNALPPSVPQPAQPEPEEIIEDRSTPVAPPNGEVPSPPVASTVAVASLEVSSSEPIESSAPTVESSAGAEADFGTSIEDPLSAEKIARPTEDPIPPKIAPSCAAVRQAWMDERHPGWSCVEWSKHTGNAYETIKKVLGWHHNQQDAFGPC
jgi:hypothetical protein